MPKAVNATSGLRNCSAARRLAAAHIHSVPAPTTMESDLRKLHSTTKTVEAQQIEQPASTCTETESRQPLAAGDAAPRLRRRLPLGGDARRLLRRRIQLLRLQDSLAHGRRRRVRRLCGGVHQPVPARDLLLILHPLQGAPRVLPDRHDGAVGDARERRARRDVVRLVAHYVRDLGHLHHVDRTRPAAFRRGDARLDAGLLAGR